MQRRHFLAGASAAALGLKGLPAMAAQLAAQAQPPVLRAAPGMTQIVPPGEGETPVWCFDGRVPGPLFRVPRGGRIRTRLENALPEATAVHWHGFRLDNAMDGVPGLTQAPVAPGGAFEIDFAAVDAGTYWYHAHARGFEQVARGLYGPVIVEEAEPPQVDAEHLLVLDDWRLMPDATIMPGFDSLHDRAHAGRIGNWVTVNGAGAWAEEAPRHARLRLRLINAATARIFTLSGRGLAGDVVALDGHPLEAPAPLERLVLAPAQRADLIVDVVAETGERAMLVSHEREGDFLLAAFDVGSAARPAPLGPVAPLAPNPVPPLGDLAAARRVDLVMDGGAMRGLQTARLEGEELDGRSLAQRGYVWAFNGEAGMPEAPLAEIPLGQTVRVVMENRSRWPHAMHLHGHHFRRIGADGTPGPLRDTTLLHGGETAAIAFVADNPGDWMFHCHMLAHAYSGMMTWLRVT